MHHLFAIKVIRITLVFLREEVGINALACVTYRALHVDGGIEAKSRQYAVLLALICTILHKLKCWETYICEGSGVP